MGKIIQQFVWIGIIEGVIGARKPQVIFFIEIVYKNE